MIMTSWWQNDDAIMKSNAKNLHVILFILLKIIIWPFLNATACSKLFKIFYSLSISPENWDFLRLGFGLAVVTEDQG